MTNRDILDRIVEYYEAHRRAPVRGYVSPVTAQRLAFGETVPTRGPVVLFQRDLYGVTQWYVDPSLPDDTVKLEPDVLTLHVEPLHE